MATRISPKKGKRRPGWRARVKIEGQSWFLGEYPTKAEAEDAEERFRQANAERQRAFRTQAGRRGAETLRRRRQSP